jgi:hypothetical protein
MKRFTLITSLFFLLLSCSPQSYKLDGDVFLTFGDGSIKPIAGRELYLFPLEVDIDESFIPPLKKFINASKFKIASQEIKEVCEAQTGEAKEFLSQSKDLVGADLMSNLNCSAIETVVVARKNLVDEDKTSFDLKTKPLNDKKTRLQNKLNEIKAKLAVLAAEEGTKLRKVQADKVTTTQYGSLGIEYDFVYTIRLTIINDSDFTVLNVKTHPVTLFGEDLIPEVKELLLSYGDGTGFRSFSSRTSYGETIPGLKSGSSAIWDDPIKIEYHSGGLPDNRWVSENKDKFEERIVCDCSSYSTYESIVPDEIVIDKESIIFGHEIEETIDSRTRVRTYKSREVDWTEEGKKTSAYRSSNLHAELKEVKKQIETNNKQLAELKSEFEESDNSSVLAQRVEELESCNVLEASQQILKEGNLCLESINEAESLAAAAGTFTSPLGENIESIFNSITENDIGYETFEDLLSAYGESRNAFKTVIGIQGSYEYLAVPKGSYVLFVTYKDRFGNDGHWFEEVQIQVDTKLDLNNTNFKKQGIYSFLRDKITK